MYNLFYSFKVQLKVDNYYYLGIIFSCLLFMRGPVGREFLLLPTWVVALGRGLFRGNPCCNVRVLAV